MRAVDCIIYFNIYLINIYISIINMQQVYSRRMMGYFQFRLTSLPRAENDKFKNFMLCVFFFALFIKLITYFCTSPI